MMFVSLGIGTVIAIILITVVSILTGGKVQNSTATPPALVGKTLGHWTQAGLDGSMVSAPWNTGHATVVVLFASWCEPCKTEFPALSTYLATHSLGKVALLGVDEQDSRSSALAFLKKEHVTMTSIFDPQTSAYNRFLLQGIPDTVFVTAKGVVQNMQIGAISTSTFAADVAALNA